jgi:hypothetical protein
MSDRLRSDAKIGNRVLIHIPTAKQWLLSRMKRPNPRRTGGRS